MKLLENKFFQFYMDFFYIGVIFLIANTFRLGEQKSWQREQKGWLIDILKKFPNKNKNPIFKSMISS